MNILILEEYPEIKREYLKYLENNNKIFDISDNYKNDEIDVLLIRSKIFIDNNLLDKYSNLKIIARVGVGLDKIDLDECNKRGIKVINTPGMNSDGVADLVLGGILTLSRKLQFGFRGIENRFNYMGNEFGEKSIGIIGFGNIGKKIYKRLLSFGVKKFFIYDPFLKKIDVEKNDFCFYIEDKKNIFEKSDIISFHIPLLESTKNFLGKNEINLLKKDVSIINTSRGGIIDENALIDFLEKNIRSSFFADVWEEEPNEPKQKLLNLENVLLTPHIGAMTYQSEEKMHFFKELI